MVAVAAMQQAQVVGPDGAVTLSAAKLSAAYGLPMADSIMMATARRYDAMLWTQDAGLQGIEGVQYVETRSGQV